LDFKNPTDERDAGDGGATLDVDSTTPNPVVDARSERGDAGLKFCNDITAHFTFDQKSLASDDGGLGGSVRTSTGPTVYEAGRYGMGVKLTGVAQVYFRIDTGGVLTSNAGSVGYWMRPDWGMPCANSPLFMKLQNVDTDPEANFAGPSLECADNALKLFVKQLDASTVVASGPAVIEANKWHYVTMSWNRGSSQIQATINGAPILRIDAPWTPQQLTATELLLNHELFPQDALIDELTMWNRAIDLNDINGLVALRGPLATECPPK
jgi:hypothetical protein